MNTCTQCGVEMEQELVDGVCPACVAKTATTPPVISAEFKPRISRLAIAGAVWAFVAIACVLLTFVVMVLMFKYKMFTGKSATPLWANILLLAFSLLSPAVAPAPLGVTILGAISSKKIRGSEGKLRGLHWAVFDCLWFPFLILAAIIGGGLLAIASFLPFDSHSSAPLVGVACFTLLPIALVDYFITRRVWIKMKSPKNPESNEKAPQVVVQPEDKKAFLVATALHVIQVALWFGSAIFIVIAKLI